MISSIVFTAANGVDTVTLNDDTTYPVEKFAWDYPTEGTDIAKGQTYGQWPTRKFVRKMTIECEGHILATSSSGYWAARKTLVKSVVPNPTNTKTNHGQLKITLEGESIPYVADVVLVGFQIPMEANYPTVTPFQFQWEAPKGYWTQAGQIVVI